MPHAAVASMITARPVLPEISNPWVRGLSLKMRDVQVRALEILVNTWIARGQYQQAIGDAERILELDPLRESAFAGLMRAHLGNGNPALGLLAYARCREILTQELGCAPGPMVNSIYHQLLAIT